MPFFYLERYDTLWFRDWAPGDQERRGRRLTGGRRGGGGKAMHRPWSPLSRSPNSNQTPPPDPAQLLTSQMPPVGVAVGGRGSQGCLDAWVWEGGAGEDWGMTRSPGTQTVAPSADPGKGF